METDQKVKLLAEDVIAKKELSNLNLDFVMEKLKKALALDKKAREKLAASEFAKFKRSKEHERIVKSVRAELRSVYGVFIMGDYKKRDGYLQALKEDPSFERHDDILRIHKSSNERLPYYDQIYEKIFEVTGLPKKILDLACGLNPISYPYLKCKPYYLACDLAEKDMEFIKAYFEAMKISGDTRKIDLMKDDLGSISKDFDVVFLFKALDSLEMLKRGVSKGLIGGLQSKYIVVSFATKSIGGRKEIKKERRAWFERLIVKLNMTSTTFEIPGELFYILKKAD
jgi:16S rRNA (guanine(1405)-N(7))-methyltransferase